MNGKTRGLLIGMGGFFAGGCAAQCVDWSTPAKAGLAIGVSMATSLVILLMLPKPSVSDRVA